MIKQEPKFKVGDLVRTSDIKKVFSKGDSTNSSYKLYKIIDVIHDTFPSYRIDYLPERYKENLTRPKNLTFQQSNQIMKGLNLIQ